MTDFHSEKVRSYTMCRIKIKATKPELSVSKFLFSKGYKYKLHVGNLAEKLDFFTQIQY
jgi:DNA mismatch endonuclease (patch repair protein)